ncbi:MAG: 1-acyl-sn-glycerol-3-phosphate acyltransferase [Bdellovibrionaceae bacterium]|nr:1-acyl-sn-glycerol-3-phosphate acyltransferase [Pseudobdellovibrionaceae bacterium]
MKTVNSLHQTIGVFSETYRHLRRAKLPNADVPQIKSDWVQQILETLKVEVEIKGTPSASNSVLFLGNHISYLDIPLLMNCLPEISFVAKQEISAWPIFGDAAKHMQTVFVKRENSNSRQSARQAVQDALTNGKRVVIFPSGTTCVDEKKSWRRGAFEIAHAADVWVQPFRITYTPLRAVAYIDRDFFPFHLYNLVGGKKIEACVEFHTPVKMSDPAMDTLYWQYWSQGIIS